MLMCVYGRRVNETNVLKRSRKENFDPKIVLFVQEVVTHFIYGKLLYKMGY